MISTRVPKILTGHYQKIAVFCVRLCPSVSLDFLRIGSVRISALRMREAQARLRSWAR